MRDVEVVGQQSYVLSVILKLLQLVVVVAVVRGLPVGMTAMEVAEVVSRVAQRPITG
jgi:hypothetical protein